MPAETNEAPAPEKARPKLYSSTREKVMFAVVLALLVGGAVTARILTGYQKVWIVNGLDVPVSVEIDGRPARVEAQGKGEERLSAGVHRVSVRSEAGAVLEERTIDVQPMNDLVVYNVLGAALLYVQKVTYSSYSYGQSKEDPDAVTVYTGVPFITRDKVDYVFTEPPQSIQVKSSGGTIVKWHVGLAPGGLNTALGYLEGQGKLAELMRISRAVAAAKPTAMDAAAYAIFMAEITEGPESAISLARSLRDKAPLVRDIHFHYQSRMSRAGRYDAVRADYRERYAKEPDSPLFGVLLSRVEDEQSGAGGALLDALLKRFPTEPMVIDWAGRRAFLKEKYAESAELFAKLKGTASEHDSADRHALSLVALGRADEARALLERAVSREGSNIYDRMVYAKLLRLAGMDMEPALRSSLVKAGEPATKAAEGARRAWILSSIGADVPGADLAAVEGDIMRAATSIQTAASNSPAAAWSACVSAPSSAIRQLDYRVAVLLAAEFARAGDKPMAERVLGQRGDFSLPPSIVFDFVSSGVEHPELKFMDPEVRAALAFVRARRLAELGEKDAEMLALADRYDIAKGIVSRARQSWPPIQKEKSAPPAAADVVTLTKKKAGAPG